MYNPLSRFADTISWALCGRPCSSLWPNLMRIKSLMFRPIGRDWSEERQMNMGTSIEKKARSYLNIDARPHLLTRFCRIRNAYTLLWNEYLKIYIQRTCMKHTFKLRELWRHDCKRQYFLHQISYYINMLTTETINNQSTELKMMLCCLYD